MGADHVIRAKTRGEATLSAVRHPDAAFPTLEWDDTAPAHQHYTCSCGAQLRDSARSARDHLLEVGALDAVAEREEAANGVN